MLRPEVLKKDCYLTKLEVCRVAWAARNRNQAVWQYWGTREEPGWTKEKAGRKKQGDTMRNLTLAIGQTWKNLSGETLEIAVGLGSSVRGWLIVKGKLHKVTFNQPPSRTFYCSRYWSYHWRNTVLSKKKKAITVKDKREIIHKIIKVTTVWKDQTTAITGFRPVLL